MKQLESAALIARRLLSALDDAVVNARELGGPMARLASDALFTAAAKRNEINNTVGRLVCDLGDEMRSIAAGLGWQELTLARVKEIAPEEGAELEQLLAQIRARAVSLREIDEMNRVRGNRALAWLRILVSGHAAGQARYDRRGVMTNIAPALSTSSRTL